MDNKKQQPVKPSHDQKVVMATLMRYPQWITGECNALLTPNQKIAVELARTVCPINEPERYISEYYIRTQLTITQAALSATLELAVHDYREFVRLMRNMSERMIKEEATKILSTAQREISSLAPPSGVLSVLASEAQRVISQYMPTGAITVTPDNYMDVFESIDFPKIKLFPLVGGKWANWEVPDHMTCMVSGPTGGGKTNLMVQMALALALPKEGISTRHFGTLAGNGHKVTYITLELTAKMILARMISVMTGISVDKITGKTPLEKDAIEILKDACDIHIAYMNGESGRATIDSIMGEVNRQAHIRGSKASVVVDYLSMIRSPGQSRYNDRAEVLAEAVRRINDYARTNGVTCIVGSQLSKAEAREGASVGASFGSSESTHPVALQIGIEGAIVKEPQVVVIPPGMQGLTMTSPGTTVEVGPGQMNPDCHLKVLKYSNGSPPSWTMRVIRTTGFRALEHDVEM